ncbi:GNAT family N-acetyltransferase [Streptomyces sp. NA04227]|nr:GNAT family N-acetyltransferase [Streptomyces sp. NA04227]QKW10741.1 GNAT family N-acetyltransferase [Streptomyces sp. NA04227]
MTALLNHDLAGASREAGVALTEFFVTEDARWVWQYRLDQLAANPACAGWITQIVVDEPGGDVVGYAGFHGPPDGAGMVELGYSVVPEHRRQGYARAILTAFLDRATAEPLVRKLRVTIRPDNTASLATISGFGFEKVGEQWDERDGREIVFELPV